MAACSSLVPEQNPIFSTPSHSASIDLCKPNASARRSLSTQFAHNEEQSSSCSGSTTLFNATSPCCTSSPKSAWRSLGVDQSELSLALTLPTGQSFRWTLTGESEYTGVVDYYLFTLRQSPNNGVEYMLHNTHIPLFPHTHEVETTKVSSIMDKCPQPVTTHIDLAEASLKNYLNLHTSLKDVWAPFIAVDPRFAALAPYMAGARLLRQNPVECLFQFICSSNNHIQRISQMVDYIAGLGPYLGTVAGLSFHAFPTLAILATVTEAELRKAGFGYRAKYIVGAVKELQAKEGGGEEWLFSLRTKTLNAAVEELCSLPGIGPKVAACIALFSLDKHDAIPVDTHVWQIATMYIMPELSGERLTPKLHTAVSEAFVKRYGKYAGWAQNVLFIAELSSHQLHLPEHLRTSRREKRPKGRKRARIIES